MSSCARLSSSEARPGLTHPRPKAASTPRLCHPTDTLQGPEVAWASPPGPWVTLSGLDHRQARRGTGCEATPTTSCRGQYVRLEIKPQSEEKLRNLLLKMRSTRRSLKTPSRASVADERVLMLVMAVSPQRPQRRDARRATAERRGPRGPSPCGSCPGERPASRGWLLSPSRPPPGARARPAS